MVIGIDARLINETGVGRYIRNLIAGLGKIDQDNTYIVFLRRNVIDSLALPNTRWQKRVADIPWHSLAEQIIMPLVFLRARLDLLHVPYFNVPILYPRPYIVTMHDVIIHHVDTGKATTLPYPLYKMRRLGYHLALTIGLARAKKIIAVSNFTKEDLVKHFSVPSEKVSVIYQGIDTALFLTRDAKSPIDGDYFLYVGNAYPHKNLNLLVRAFNTFFLQIKNTKQKESLPKLVLVGKEDFFYRRLKEDIQNLDCKENVVLYGWVNDSELGALYGFARGFMYPSLIEGFGLPPLEAMIFGTPVLVSDIPVFHEVLGETPLYFRAQSPDDLLDKMQILWYQSPKLKKSLPKPAEILQKYRWEETAKRTLQSYQSALA